MAGLAWWAAVFAAVGGVVWLSVKGPVGLVGSAEVVATLGVSVSQVQGLAERHGHDVHPRCGHHHQPADDCPVPYTSPAGLLARV